MDTRACVWDSVVASAMASVEFEPLGGFYKGRIVSEEKSTAAENITDGLGCMFAGLGMAAVIVAIGFAMKLMVHGC